MNRKRDLSDLHSIMMENSGIARFGCCDKSAFMFLLVIVNIKR